MPRSFCNRRDCRRNVDSSSPQPANRDQHEKRIQDCASSPHSREQHRDRLPESPCVNNIAFFEPACRFADSAPYPREQQGRQATKREHRTPAEMAANTIVGNRGQKNSHVVSSVHPSCARSATIFWPFFGNESSAHSPFSTNTDAG